MTRRETANAVSVPVKRIINSSEVKLNPNLMIFISDAPAIVGIPMKNENSAAVVLSNPSSRAPMIVAPDLDVPGTRERIWNSPVYKARG